jgi:hypothetical protein
MKLPGSDRARMSKAVSNVLFNAYQATFSNSGISIALQLVRRDDAVLASLVIAQALVNQVKTLTEQVDRLIAPGIAHTCKVCAEVGRRTVAWFVLTRVHHAQAIVQIFFNNIWLLDTTKLFSTTSFSTTFPDCLVSLERTRSRALINPQL